MSDATGPRNGLSELHVDDLRMAVAKLPDPVAEWLRQVGPNAFVAGGHIRSCVTGDRLGDVDIFVRDSGVMAGFFDQVEGQPFVTDFAKSLPVGGRIVQVICWRYFDTPADLLAHFDFTVCQAALWWHGDGWGGPARKGSTATWRAADSSTRGRATTVPPSTRAGRCCAW